MDRLEPNRRSWLMSRVGGKNTSPEFRVRKAAHALGLRFRLHQRNLPGTPDLVFPKWNMVILVHGCFWHRHPGCRKASIPKTNTRFWIDKFDRNIARDREVAGQLLSRGWTVEVIWECETRCPDALARRIKELFERMGRAKSEKTYRRSQRNSCSLPTPSGDSR